MKGFRTPAQAGRKERLAQIEAELKNLQMAGRITQMMVQQMMQSNKAMSEDLGRSLGLISELQYKLLAAQRVANLDVTQMNTVAAELRLKDFNEASDREDAELNYTNGTVVAEDSIVIITSTTSNPDSGIFRSKLALAESGSPELIKELTGKEVGAKVTVKLNGVEHTVELLGIRQPPKAEPALTLQGQPEGNA